MQERVINVFYGAEALPYKDKERTVHFPIVGNAFMGASNTTEIRFYADRIGGDARQWVCIGKLPNGKRGFKILPPSVYDEENDEYYLSFSLTSFFTQYKGDLFLSLGGYNGNFTELNDEDEYELVGNTVVETTGAIKLNIAYSTPINGSDEEVETWEDYLEALGTKLDKIKGIVVIENTSANISAYDNGQLFYVKSDNKLYINDSGSLVLFNNPLGNNVGFIYKTSYSSLTSEELNEAIKHYCILVISSGLTNYSYIKSYETSGTIFFVDTDFGLSNGSTNANISKNVIQINKLTKELTSGTTTVEFYNTTQANNRFLKKAGDTATGEIVFNNYAPKTGVTITDSMPNTVLITKQYLIDYLSPHISDYNTLLGIVNGILGLIPSEATSENKLVDRDTMNSTINSLAAFFRGNYDNYETPQESGNTTLMGVAWQTQHKNQPYYVSNNDYAYVNDDETHDHEAWRYIYVEGTGWQPQFRVNEAPLTADQLAALNSGITSALVSLITTNQNNIATLNSKMPKHKDFTITSDLWALDSVSGKYVCEVDAGSDFAFTDLASKIYTAISDSDVLIKDTYGINVSSNATTQKFTFICTRGNAAPTETVNFNICVIGG